MLLSAVSVLVVAQSSSEIPMGLMNNPVYQYQYAGKIFYKKTQPRYKCQCQVTLLFCRKTPFVK